MKVTVKEAFKMAQETSYPLIAVHRGSAAGVVISNTELGARASLAAGGDMVELDVARSSDGVYFSFHDTYEPILLGESRTIGQMTADEIEKLPYYGIQGSACGYPQRYSDTLAALPGVLINVDRSYRYWEDGFLDDLATWADPDCILIKSDPSQEYLGAVASCATKFPYMAVVKNREEIEKACKAAAGGNIDLIAFEIIANESNDPLLDPQYLRSLNESGYALWFNAINLENGSVLCAGFDDSVSIFDDPDQGWGKLVDLGATVIQTDWPSLLRKYLNSRCRN